MESITTTFWKQQVRYIPVTLQEFQYAKVIIGVKLRVAKDWGWWSAASYLDEKFINYFIKVTLIGIWFPNDVTTLHQFIYYID